MNMRDLMDLVVLNTGRALEMIETRLFSITVVMALVTSFLTVPLLSLTQMRPDRLPESLDAIDSWGGTRA